MCTTAGLILWMRYPNKSLTPFFLIVAFIPHPQCSSFTRTIYHEHPHTLRFIFLSGVRCCTAQMQDFCVGIAARYSVYWSQWRDRLFIQKNCVAAVCQHTTTTNLLVQNMHIRKTTYCKARFNEFIMPRYVVRFFTVREGLREGATRGTSYPGREYESTH